MTYSKWFDLLGLWSCLWLMSCIIPNTSNQLSIVFLLLLAACASVCLLHVVADD